MDSETVGGTLIHRGAEADLFLSKFGNWDTVVKRRIPKSYRDPRLDDRIRKERTTKEAIALHEARKGGVRTPVVLSVDLEKTTIVMTYVKGILARDNLDKVSGLGRLVIFRELGRLIGLLHSGGIVHGDLTTSNIIVTKGNTPFLLDFGMSSRSNEMEDRGVDLHLLRRSITTTHAVDESSCWRELSKGYRKTLGLGEALGSFRKATEIAKRGRYFALR